MNALLLLTATAALGIDYGYQPLPTGGVEYIIQIEPQLLAQVAQGKPIMSDVPAGLDVRRFRIMVGTGQLPRELPPASIRDGRPKLQEDPTDSRPQLRLDETDRSRPVMRSDEAAASPASATGGFPSEAPPQTPFDRRPMEVTAESQQSRPVLAPELEAAPPPQSRVEPRYESNPLSGSRYAREMPPASAPLRAADPGLRVAERTAPPVEMTQPNTRYSSQPSMDQPLQPQPQQNSLFGQGRQFGAPASAPPSELSPTLRQKPPLTEDQEEAVRESQTPFWTALFGLFCSAGGNIYLGWMTWSARMKYHNLIHKFRSQPSPA